MSESIAEQRFSLALTLRDGYAFSVDFEQEGVPSLLLDEPPPLGAGRGPNATRVLAAAVGNCLGASLLFCLRKSRVDVRELRTTVAGRLVRNEQGRFRIAEIRVRLTPDVPPEQRERMRRCLGLFEDFCTVTESVRQGIHVDVEVDPVPVVAGVTQSG
jgi:organic hydroperoxide reductase OsmC/OhrA